MITHDIKNTHARKRADTRSPGALAFQTHINTFFISREAQPRRRKIILSFLNLLFYKDSNMVESCR